MTASASADRIVTNERLTGAARLAELAAIKAKRKRTDRIVELLLLSAACVSVFTTLGIVYILLLLIHKINSFLLPSDYSWDNRRMVLQPLESMILKKFL